MARVFKGQRKYEKKNAVEWYERAIAGTEKAVISGIGNSGYPQIQDIIRELADLYERMEQQEQAQRLHLRLAAMTQGPETTSMEISQQRCNCQAVSSEQVDPNFDV